MAKITVTPNRTNTTAEVTFDRSKMTQLTHTDHQKAPYKSAGCLVIDPASEPDVFYVETACAQTVTTQTSDTQKPIVPTHLSTIPSLPLITITQADLNINKTQAPEGFSLGESVNYYIDIVDFALPDSEQAPLQSTVTATERYGLEATELFVPDDYTPIFGPQEPQTSDPLNPPAPQSGISINITQLIKAIKEGSAGYHMRRDLLGEEAAQKHKEKKQEEALRWTHQGFQDSAIHRGSLTYIMQTVESTGTVLGTCRENDVYIQPDAEQEQPVCIEKSQVTKSE